MLNTTNKMTEIPLDKMLSDYTPGVLYKDFTEPPKTCIYFDKIDESSLQEFHNYSVKEEIYEFFEFDIFKNIEDTARYFNKMKKRMNVEKSHYYWFIRSKVDNNLIGTASLAEINFNRKSVQWGQAIDPSYWGMNHNLEVHEILKHYVFEVLKFNRIWGTTMVNNTRAIAGVKASGCTYEGTFREFYFKDNQYIDAWCYSLLSSEYFDSLLRNNGKELKVHEADFFKIIKPIFNGENLNRSSSMSNTAAWDSLTHMQVIAAISKEFDLVISPRDFAMLNSVDKILNFIGGSLNE